MKTRVVKLSEELAAAGYEGDAIEFKDRLCDLFFEMFGSWTVEELLYHPREELHFCNMVRRDRHVPELPDSTILRTLQNMRKNTFRDDISLRGRRRQKRSRNAEAVAT